VAQAGSASLALALGFLAFAVVGGGFGAAVGSARFVAAARNAMIAAFASTLLAAAILEAAFLRHDFAIRYVATHASRSLPLAYTAAAVWSGQEGSLLLWLLVLTGAGTAALLVSRRLVREVLPATIPVLAGVGSFFAIVLVFVAKPFATQVAPLDGRGMNPSLQNAYMLAHPPMLYVGYVGLTIPFAFAMAALLHRRVDERWVVATRRWAVVAWAFLGIGILLGAKWAYEEIGWGGYYAWDPVENAALMPWLATTAYLHSVMIQEKKNMLRVWNVVLVALAFSLSLFGTFLTRSGVINSVHSFAQSPVGGWFLGFIAIVIVFAATVIAVRLPLLRGQTRLQSIVSREAAFLYNNLLLVALCLTVLWGVAFPLVTEAVRGDAFTVGPPYFNFFLRLFGLPLLLLMGIGPLVAWRRSSLRRLGRTLRTPAAVAVAAGAALAFGGAGSRPIAVAGYSFAIFALAAIAREFVLGTRARRSATGEGWVASLFGLVGRNRRRYGGYVVHCAVVLLAFGIIGTACFGATKETALRPSDTISIGDYLLRLDRSYIRVGANALQLRAALTVFQGGRRVGEVVPGKNRYFVEGETSNEVAIRTDWRRAEDLFVIAQQFDRNGTVYVKVLVNPLVDLIWLAGGLFLFGCLVALWPQARPAARTAIAVRPPKPAEAV
jgi:cytochrome c-type biogenesis protein CcmF